jgi:hypothetical protein
MKIRIFDDHVRLRLDRAEVLTVSEGRTVHCHTRFPDGMVFGYRLEPGVPEAAARFEAGTVVVGLPDSAVQQWATDDSEVSIRFSLPVSGGNLHVLVEKDFECLDPREGEDQSNRFVNPKSRLPPPA